MKSHPHDQRTFVVSVPQFEKWAKEVKISQPEKGRFVLVDGTGRDHKSWKVKDWMSMAPKASVEFCSLI